MDGAMVATQRLCKNYRSIAALVECDLRVAPGEVFGLLGPNGSGKTTLLRLLMGFLRPTAGTARIDGLDCYRDSLAVHRRVSYLPGETRLFRQARLRDVLKFFCGLRGDGSDARAAALADRLRLDLGRSVGGSSTGMRQKLALAVVLSADAPLIILDEPTSNLDPTVRGEVAALVRESRRAGRTVIFSSHVLDEVEEVCDRVGILCQGRLAHVQDMSQLRLKHRIRARLTAALPKLPDDLKGQIELTARGDELTILTAGELTALLGWLATLPLAQVRIEPVGLRTIYDQYHAA